jgi:low affinity Fe/Cu permease
MRIPQSYVQKCKVVAHIFQAIFIFVALCITIAVSTMHGRTGGATKFYLALVGPPEIVLG